MLATSFVKDVASEQTKEEAASKCQFSSPLRKKTTADLSNLTWPWIGEYKFLEVSSQ